MKIRPAGMTFAAKDSFPMSDSSARFVHLVRVLNVWSLCRIAVSLSVGRLATPAKVYIDIHLHTKKSKTGCGRGTFLKFHSYS